MLRFAKRAAAVSAIVLGLALVIVYGVSGSKLSRDYGDLVEHPLVVPTDAVSIAEGRRLTRVFHCVDCHREDFGGGVMVDAFVMGTITSSNLTSGEGGVGGEYSPIDWERAVRHGVRPDGSTLVFMPSEDFGELSDADVGRIVAYLRSLPPVDRVAPDRRIGPVARGFMAVGVFGTAADFEHHESDEVGEPERIANADFGRYLVGVCMGCHGRELAGGMVEPGLPPASNLTPHPTEGLGQWSFEDFERAIRTGVRPDGRVLDDLMPWRSFSFFDDVEAQALWAYLQELPPMPDGY